MPEILALSISAMIVAGPLMCGLAATWAASKIFHDSWATCITIGVITAILVGFVVRPLHKERNPHLYGPKVDLEFGPKPNGNPFRP
jgi:hypothetical protein